MAPRYWRLANLAESEGDLKAAREYLDDAARLFREALVAACDAHAQRVSSDTLLPELAVTLAQVANPTFDSLIVHVRGHLLREAEWLRLQKEPDSAWDVLLSAQSIRPDAWRDESGLNFNEPLEALRIALARGDFNAALTFADQAEQNLTGQAFPAERGLTRAPVSVLTQAELRFLRGVAKAGFDPTDPEATKLIRSSIDVVRPLVDSVPTGFRNRLHGHLETWNDVEMARGDR